MIKNKASIKPLKIIGIMVFLVGCLWLVVLGFNEQKLLEVSFFNVGQGDAIFVEVPGGRQILIDGGPDNSILGKLKKEMPLFDNTIDLIILTHADADHISGLLDVLKRYRVKNILWTGAEKNNSWELAEWKDLLNKEGAQIKIAQSGQRIFLSNDQKIFFDVIYPFESLEGRVFDGLNDTSIVGRLVFGENSFLFTGDGGEDVEREIVLKNNINSDILKVAHHGSKYSTPEDFLQAVSPGLAIISVGENNYGHPSKEVLARLAKFAIETLITQEKGDIKITSNGKKLNINY
jgi:competence protein ComEC